jgi:hypothetical protein
MSEEIVACPGCAKKFRIPEGAPPGSFACTACEADVPYGAPPSKAGPKAPVRPAPAVAKPAPAVAARPAAAARPAPVAARAAPVASSRRAAPAPSRRAGRGQDDEPAPKKDNHGLIWAGIGIGGAVVLGLAYFLTKPASTPPAAPPSTPSAPVAKASEPKPKPAEAPKAEAAAPATTPAPAVKPETPKPEAPKPEGAKPDAAKPDAATPEAKAPDPTKKVKGDFSALGQTFASVDGMSEADRATADKLVTTAMDLQSGKDGSEAEGKLLQLGKKAIPSILSAFSKQYTNGKWASNEDQYAADKLQDLLHRIAGADGLNPKQEFWPRFMSGAPPEDFEKAANLWVSWWTSKGQFATKFKRASD